MWLRSVVKPAESWLENPPLYRLKRFIMLIRWRWRLHTFNAAFTASVASSMSACNLTTAVMRVQWLSSRNARWHYSVVDWKGGFQILHIHVSQPIIQLKWTIISVTTMHSEIYNQNAKSQFSLLIKYLTRKYVSSVPAAHYDPCEQYACNMDLCVS